MICYGSLIAREWHDWPSIYQAWGCLSFLLTVSGICHIWIRKNWWSRLLIEVLVPRIVWSYLRPGLVCVIETFRKWQEHTVLRRLPHSRNWIKEKFEINFSDVVLINNQCKQTCADIISEIPQWSILASKKCLAELLYFPVANSANPKAQLSLVTNCWWSFPLASLEELGGEKSGVAIALLTYETTWDQFCKYTDTLMTLTHIFTTCRPEVQ